MEAHPDWSIAGALLIEEQLNTLMGVSWIFTGSNWLELYEIHQKSFVKEAPPCLFLNENTYRIRI